MSDILPCPFCGASASIEECDGGSYGVRFSVGCDSETEADCMGYQSFTTFFNTRKEAVVAWNKRTDATLRAELAEVTEELEAWTKRGPISGDEVILIAEARDQARRELAAERYLERYNAALRTLEREYKGKATDAPCMLLKRRYLVQVLLGEKLVTYRSYVKDWKPGIQFQFHDQVHFVPVTLKSITRSKEYGGTWKYEYIL